MVGDDDRRTGTRNPLQLPFVELETDLQELQRLRCEVAGRSRPSAGLAMDIRESFESEGALSQVQQQRAECRHLTEGCIEIEWRTVVMLHEPQTLVRLRDKRVAPRRHNHET